MGRGRDRARALEAEDKVNQIASRKRVDSLLEAIANRDATASNQQFMNTAPELMQLRALQQPSFGGGGQLGGGGGVPQAFGAQGGVPQQQPSLANLLASLGQPSMQPARFRPSSPNTSLLSSLGQQGQAQNTAGQVNNPTAFKARST